MTTFPRSPRVLKGAIVALDLPNPTPDVIVFQYNPETLTRRLEVQAADTGEGSGPLRHRGAPTETIDLEVEIDATDQLEKEEDHAVRMGIYPQLSALEMLLYPSSTQVKSKMAQMALGVIEIIPPPAPFTLFIYGPRRVVPVRLTDFSITEEAHDVNLNPIRATVSLGLRVLTYNDLDPMHPGHALFLAHQIAKEAMARIGSVGSISAAGGEDINLL